MIELEKKANYYEKSLTNDYVENTCIDKLIQQSYKDGYEQGQKDNCETHKECQFLKYFEKENEELKAQIEDIANINIKAQTIIADQKQQIIKMKCCGNCKHYRYDYEDRYCLYDATRDKDCVNYSEWELAE